MTLAISHPYRASELFRPACIGPRAGKPWFMNISAHRHPGRPIKMEALQGAGLYGLFLDGKLFYVGIYSGAKTDSFSGTVLTRWRLHLTYQTLRSPYFCFTAADLAKILDDETCAPFDAIAEAVGGRQANLAQHALIQTNGATCTYQKARFAAQNWNLFQQGNEDCMFGAVSFVFARLKPEVLAGAAPMDRSHRQWIKTKWLKRCECTVIRALKPICNNETKKDCEEYAAYADFERELMTAASIPFPPYRPSTTTALETPVVNAASLGDRATDTKKLEADQEAPTAEHAADLETEAMSVGEARFRERLSCAAEALIDEMDQILPPGIEMGFVNIPELRLYREPGHAVLLKITVKAGGSMIAYARTSTAVVKALGFEGAVAEPFWTRFSLDTQRHQPSAIIALAGAALSRQI